MSFLRGRRARPWERGHSGPKSASQEIFDSIRPAPRGTDPFRISDERKLTRRARNLLLTAAVPVVAIGVVWTLVSGDVGSKEAARPAQEIGGTPDNEATPSPEPPSVDRRGYALALPELDGLPEHAAAGTRLELWVAWDPPVTKEPRVQRLLKDVVLEEIVPPIWPEAPATAVLSVPTRSLPDLLFGDRYGALSVALMPGAD